MHTIEQLQSGKLQGITRLELKQGLSEFPLEIIELADSLEVLDLSDNQLHDLPDCLAQLHQLKILFLTNNRFETIPSVLALCPKLEMISFKSNQLQHISAGALPDDTRWLILTDNKLAKLPEDMGRLHRLQKLALAGNKLTELPASMADCQRLELARLSANAFTTLPDWLFQLPKLSWLAVDGNPLHSGEAHIDSTVTSPTCAIPLVQLDDVELQEVIGQGASGVIYRAKWLKQPAELHGTDESIAVKIFKGEVTSDGYPQDELINCLQAGQHNNLIKVIAQINQVDKLGLVMELIPSQFANLGLPPSLQTCTRDTFDPNTQHKLATMVKMLHQMASGLTHLHHHQVSHGDIYAHNTMFNANADILFGDFGAATNLNKLPESQRKAMQSIEVRALGCLMDDLLTHLNHSEPHNHARLTQLTSLTADCMQHTSNLRPQFSAIEQQLQQLLHELSLA